MKAKELVGKMYEHTGWLATTKEGYDNQDIECSLVAIELAQSFCENKLTSDYCELELLKKEVEKLRISK